MTPVRVAVIGAGQFGRNHLRVVSTLQTATLAAVVDSDPERAHAAAIEFNTIAIKSIDELAGRVDAAIVAVPTIAHGPVGLKLLEAGIDVLVEKPIAQDLETAHQLINSAARHGRILQIGHLERQRSEIEGAIDATSAMSPRPAGTLRINTSEGAAHQVLTSYVREYVKRATPQDLRNFLEGAELTAVRAGMFVAGEVEPVKKMVMGESGASQRVASRSKIRDLMVFGVSEDLHALRAAVGVQVEVAARK